MPRAVYYSGKLLSKVGLVDYLVLKARYQTRLLGRRIIVGRQRRCGEMSKVPCAKCGVAILESTAEKNGGLCAPCKAGTREPIEAARARNKEERERENTDPLRLLWRNLVHRAYEANDGLSGFSEAEKQYFAVGLLDGEVYNGGFDQFFFNSSGSYFKYAIAGLEAMDAQQSLVLLQRAKQVLFDFDEVYEDTEKRRAFLLQRVSDSRTKRLEELDAQYWKDPDSLAIRSEQFARSKGLVK